MTAEAKIRMLARQDATLQGYFFTGGQVRWFDIQEKPGYIKTGTCARVRRISTLRMQAHGTRAAVSVSEIEQIRFQIDVLDTDPERARSAAAAIRDWLATVDFSSTDQFVSPPSSPKKHPNFVLNEFAGIIPQTQPPVYTETLDVRISNLEE